MHLPQGTGRYGPNLEDGPREPRPARAASKRPGRSHTEARPRRTARDAVSSVARPSPGRDQLPELLPGPQRSRPPATRPLHHERNELKAFGSTNRFGVLVAALPGLVVCRRLCRVKHGDPRKQGFCHISHWSEGEPRQPKKAYWRRLGPIRPYWPGWASPCLGSNGLYEPTAIPAVIN